LFGEELARRAGGCNAPTIY
jgi:hypothetical protein